MNPSKAIILALLIYSTGICTGISIIKEAGYFGVFFYISLLLGIITGTLWEKLTAYK